MTSMTSMTYVGVEPPERFFSAKSGTYTTSQDINIKLSNDNGSIYNNAVSSSPSLNVLTINTSSNTPQTPVDTPGHESTPNYKTNMSSPDNVIKRKMQELDASIQPKRLKTIVPDQLAQTGSILDTVSTSATKIGGAIMSLGFLGSTVAAVIPQGVIPTLTSLAPTSISGFAQSLNPLGASADGINQFIPFSHNLSSRGLSGDNITTDVQANIGDVSQGLDQSQFYDVPELVSNDVSEFYDVPELVSNSVTSLGSETVVSGLETGTVGAETLVTGLETGTTAVAAGEAVAVGGAEATAAAVGVAASAEVLLPLAAAAALVVGIGYAQYKIDKGVQSLESKISKKLGI